MTTPRPRRRPAFTCCVSALVVLTAALVAARGQQPQGPDPERGFAFGDTDLDGRLTLDELRELFRGGARLKGANVPAKKAQPAAMAEMIFRRLDADQDGSLTLPEYLKIVQLRQGGLGPFPGVGGGAFKKAFTPAPTSPKAAAPVASDADRPVTAEGAKLFESKIRPVLATKCAGCHAADAEKVKGGLLVDSREGLRKGGDTGPAVVPGDPDESLLIRAIRYHDEDLRMPPKAPLPAGVVADFEAWVKMGAPDPRVGGPKTAAPPAGVGRATGRPSWAFQSPRRAAPPAVKDGTWPRTAIDQFLLAVMEARGVRPVADAGRSTLIRRVTFDLIGLPPTPEEVEAFAADTSDNAFAKVVDRLLASPRFGERWGRHWLDVARYAESSGKANMLYPQAWRYRDWVIAAFNADMPYDRFVRDQIAGDLLEDGDDRRRAEGVVATGFLAVGSKTHNTQNRKQFLVDLADEQIDVTGQAFLGLTVACARCHDHKFDPIPQRDYYALSGVFQSTQTCYGTLPGLVQNTNPSPLITIPDAAGLPSLAFTLTPDRRAFLEGQLADLVKTRDALTPEENFTPKGFQTRARLAMVTFRLASFKPDGTPKTYAMGARERYEPIDSPLYTRGELEHPGEVVPRGLPALPGAATPGEVAAGSGRRELAGWLASRDNPLTARVMVNRVWLHLFGRGIVPSPDNFGAAGQPPSHPELLDALAVSFMDGGWSVKALIRRIVLSRAYQLGSNHDARNAEADPDNALVWRVSKKRLEAEAVRDAVLAVSGRLVVEPPAGSPVAAAGEGLAGPFRNFNQDAQDLHRAVYLPVVRDQVPDSLAAFDFADPSLPTGERSTTTGPSQALFLMNSPFVIREATAAARLLLSAGGDDESRVKAAYLRFLGRAPDAAEAGRARDFLAASGPDARGPEDARHSTWAVFCQALYASAEFRYVD